MSSARKLFVEGGGQNDALKTECRRAFAALLEKAGFRGRMPRVVACGGRRNAYEQFAIAMRDAAPGWHFLLVDSETPVVGSDPWKHVGQRQGDQWKRPEGASDDQLHFMVQCMETWFLADREALRGYFGQGFREGDLPPEGRRLESVSKQELADGLAQVTRPAKTRGEYRKGKHSFELLARLDPTRIRKASPWAERFFGALYRLMA